MRRARASGTCALSVNGAAAETASSRAVHGRIEHSRRILAAARFRRMESDDRVRIDKWLWAARFFKTRSLATEAVDGGKVEVNGERAKPAKLVRIGDMVRLRLAPYEHILIIKGMEERRGPASVAQGLYEETAASKEAREKLATQL